MFSPGQGALRLTRALGLAMAAYALSLGAHLAGGGRAPSTLGTGVLLLTTWWVSVMLTGQRLGRLPLIGLLGMSQLLLHAALEVAGSAGACMTVVHAHAGHLTNGAMTVCSDAASAPAVGSMSHHGGSGVAMTLAHAVAAVLLGLVLARGEAALWFLASLVWPAARKSVVLPTPTPAQAVAVENLLGPVAACLPGGVGRRGPPPRCALATH